MTIFGPGWDQLTLADVERYLVSAEDEPLLWEAKGTALDGHAVRKEVGAFANSHEGGYLILGAEYQQEAKRWELSGLTFPDEPRVWIGNVLREGLRPLPPFDVRPFSVADRHVAVVRVDPTPAPPCIVRGTVYERIPGQAIPVRAPERLAELFTRGDLARREALQAATEQAGEPIKDRRVTPPGDITKTPLELSVGLTGLRRPENLSGRIFTRDFESQLCTALSAITRRATGFELPCETYWRQDRLGAAAKDVEEREWQVEARWNGAAGFYMREADEPVPIDQLVNWSMSGASRKRAHFSTVLMWTVPITSPSLSPEGCFRRTLGSCR